MTPEDQQRNRTNPPANPAPRQERAPAPAAARGGPAPLNRRRALRVLATLSAAAAGAAAATALRPEQAQGAIVFYTDTTSNAVLSAFNRGTGNAVEGVNNGPQAAVFGSSIGSYGVHGTSGYIGVKGSAGDSSGAAGVYGTSGNIGVWGQTDSAAAGVGGGQLRRWTRGGGRQLRRWTRGVRRQHRRLRPRCARQQQHHRSGRHPGQ